MTTDLRDLSARFLRGVSTAAEDGMLIRGLLHAGLEPGAADAGSASPGEDAYGAALDSLAGRIPSLEREVERESAAGRQLALRLEADGPAAAAGELAAVSERAARLAFEELCESSQQACSRDPQRAVRLGETALAVAVALVDADLEARAEARIANAQRVRGDFPTSAAAIARARARLSAGLGSPIARGDVAFREAALLADQSRFVPALRRSRAAGRWFARAGAELEVLRAELQQANVLRELDRVPEALAVLEGAAAGLAPELAEPAALRLRFAVATNRACFQAELGQLAAAEAGLNEARQLANALDNPLDAPRVDWIEAFLRGEQGRLSEAEALLLRVRRRYLELDLAHDVALATLELALVVARQGRFAEAQRLALEALPTFEALRVSPEAVAAVRLAVGAAREEAVRVEALRAALKRLRR